MKHAASATQLVRARTHSLNFRKQRRTDRLRDLAEVPARARPLDSTLLRAAQSRRSYRRSESVSQIGRMLDGQWTTATRSFAWWTSCARSWRSETIYYLRERRRDMNAKYEPKPLRSACGSTKTGYRKEAASDEGCILLRSQTETARARVRRRQYTYGCTGHFGPNRQLHDMIHVVGVVSWAKNDPKSDYT